MKINELIEEIKGKKRTFFVWVQISPRDGAYLRITKTELLSTLMAWGSNESLPSVIVSDNEIRLG